MNKSCEPKEKDIFLQELYKHQGKYISDKELSKKIDIKESSLIHYGKELEMYDYIKTAHSFDGWSFIITDSGIHFAENETFEKIFQDQETDARNEIVDREDERLTRKVTRNTARVSIGISALAFLVALFALLSQIFGWFK